MDEISLERYLLLHDNRSSFNAPLFDEESTKIGVGYKFPSTCDIEDIREALYTAGNRAGVVLSTRSSRETRGQKSVPHLQMTCQRGETFEKKDVSNSRTSAVKLETARPSDREKLCFAMIRVVKKDDSGEWVVSAVLNHHTHHFRLDPQLMVPRLNRKEKEDILRLGKSNISSSSTAAVLSSTSGLSRLVLLSQNINKTSLI